MTNDTKTCPTCGQPIRRFTDNIFKKAVVGGIAGIVFGILFGIWFSNWWFGPGMHSTPMAIIHYFAWGALFGFVGAVIGLVIRK
ncbi:MAG: hypothetical protein HY266_09805 [Deltaproteobacteria bacterium]|nr:hypothetical protein [Deltaproteobacteria bacterium]